ncbi:MAG: hypothetical protein ABIQ70_08060 [Dokdonella sp.]
MPFVDNDELAARQYLGRITVGKLHAPLQRDKNRDRGSLPIQDAAAARSGNDVQSILANCTLMLRNLSFAAFGEAFKMDVHELAPLMIDCACRNTESTRRGVHVREGHVNAFTFSEFLICQGLDSSNPHWTSITSNASFLAKVCFISSPSASGNRRPAHAACACAGDTPKRRSATSVKSMGTGVHAEIA